MTRLRTLTAAAAVLLTWACTDGAGPTETGRLAPLDIAPRFQLDPSLFTYDPIDRIRLAAFEVETSAVVGSLTRDVDPGATAWVLDLGVDLGGASSLRVIVEMELLSSGTVQWSGRLGPLAVPTAGVVQALDLFPGPLDNLDVLAVDVVNYPSQMQVGTTQEVFAFPLLAAGSSASPVVFWASSDPTVVTVSDQGTTVTLTAVAEGTADIQVAVGEAFEEFAVTVVTAPVVKTWVGGAPNNPNSWQANANWSPPFVPTSTDDVVIPPTANDARTGLDSFTADLTVESGAALWVAGSNVLSVGGTLTLESGAALQVDGTITAELGCDDQGATISGNGTHPCGPAPGTKTWIGGDGGGATDWGNPSNWSPAGVPGPSDDVVVAGAAYDPTLAASTEVRSIVVGTPNFVDLGSFTLTVSGDVQSGEGFANGTVRVTGDGTVLQGVFDDLEVAGTQRALSDDTYVYGSLSLLDARLDVGPQNLYVDVDLFVDGPGGLLVMTDPLGFVSVFGDALFNGGAHDGLMTAGALDVFGQFHATDASPTSFAATETHRTYLSGSVAQTVLLEIPGPSAQRFNDLQILNGAGVTFQGNAHVGRDVALYGRMVVPQGTTTSVGRDVTLASGSELVVDGVLTVVGQCTDNGATILGTGEQPCGAPAPVDRTWQGGDGNGATAWDNPNNWSPVGVPAPADNVLVPSLNYQPVLSSSAAVGSLAVEGTLDQGGFTLTVTGDASVTGTVFNGTTDFASGPGTTLDGAFDHVVVSGPRLLSGGLIVSGDLLVLDQLEIGPNQAYVYGDFTVDGAAAHLVLHDQTSQLSVEGSVHFDGGSSVADLTTGVIQTLGDFTARSTHSPTSFQSSGTIVAIHPFEVIPTVDFDNPGPGGQSFVDFYVIPNQGLAAKFATDVLVTGMLSAGNATLRQGGTATLEVRGTLELDVVTFDGLPLRVVSDLAPNGHTAENLTFTNFPDAATQLYLELPGGGANAPFTLYAPVFDQPEPTQGWYVDVVNSAPQNDILVIEVIDPTPQTANRYQFDDQDTEFFWNP